MLGKHMPGLGVEQLLDKSVTGAFLMRSYGAEKRILLADTAEGAHKNVRSFLQAHGRLLDPGTLGEQADLAGLVGENESDCNPAVLLVRLGTADGQTEVYVRAWAKESVQQQHSAERALDALEQFLNGTDGVLQAVLKALDL